MLKILSPKTSSSLPVFVEKENTQNIIGMISAVKKITFKFPILQLPIQQIVHLIQFLKDK